MTPQQAFLIAMSIIQNENRSIAELSDRQISVYLVDAGVDETAANIAMIREA